MELLIMNHWSQNKAICEMRYGCAFLFLIKGLRLEHILPVKASF